MAFHWKYSYNVSLHHCMRTKGGSGHVILRAAPDMLFSVRLNVRNVVECLPTICNHTTIREIIVVLHTIGTI